MDANYSRGDRSPILIRKVDIGEQNEKKKRARGGIYESVSVRAGSSESRATPAKSIIRGQLYFAKFDGGYHPVVADNRQVMHLVNLSGLEDQLYR